MPNDNVIDNLSIEIVSKASEATRQLDDVLGKLTKLSTALKGIKMPNMNMGLKSTTADNLQKLSNVIYGLNLDKLREFGDAAKNISFKIGINDKTATNLSAFNDSVKDFDVDKLKEFAIASANTPKLNLGINAETGLNMRSFAAALQGFPSHILVGLGAITKRFQPLNTGIRSDTGENLRSFGSALNGLNLNRLVGFGSATQNIQKINLGLSKDSGSNLTSFGDALENIDLTKMATFASITNGMQGVNTGLSPSVARNLTLFSDSLNEIDLERLRELSRVFKEIGESANNISMMAKSIKEMDATGNKLVKSLRRVDTENKKVANSTKQVHHATSRARHTFNLANTALGKLFNSIKRIAFYRVIRSAIKSVTQGFAEGIENLYRWSQAWGTSFAPAMDQLKTAQTYLKNGFASMFSPLIEYAVPIIDTVIDKIVDMFNAVQELFAQLTGASTWNKAIKYPVKYKDDLDAAAGSAKALQNILMDFDEINAINTPNDSGRGSGKEAEDYSKMFELVQTSTKSDSALSKFIESLNKLNFEPLKNSLKNLWNDGINPILTYFKENGDRFLSPLVEFFVEEGLPTAIDLVTASLKPLLSIIQPLLDSGFMEDVAGKLSKVNGIVKDFADFLGTLDFRPLGEALSSLWNNALSPIIDRLIDVAGWIQDKVIKPITQFLVEKGIPAAIGAIEEALKAIWSILEPILEGLQKFWEQNGPWIMEMIEEHTMKALEKIKEAFGAIGQFFKKNSDKIKGIFSNISTVIQYLAPVIKEIFGLIGTIGWDSFINGIHNTLDILQPILDVISGIFKIITVFFTGDGETFKSGLADIGTAIWNGILFPFKLVIRAIATVLDVLGRIWPECKEGAHNLRVMIGDEAEYIEETVKGTGVKIVQEANGTFSALDSVTGEYVTATGARLSQEEIEMNEAFANMMSSGAMLGKSFKEQSELSVQWLAYCRDYGVDPTTGSIIMATEEMLKLGPAGQHAARDIVGAFSGALNYDSGNKIGRVYGSGFVNGVDAQNRGRTVGHTFGDAVAKNANSKELVNQFTSALTPTAGFNLGKQFGNAIQNGINPSAIGWNLGSQMAQSAQNALNMSPLQLKATINATINSVNANDKWRAALAAAGVSIAGFASGGFPPMSTGSLFVAGEGGVPELMGKVGGRTAVAGGQEITGIREAIEAQGQAEQGLLRQMIAAIQNKDLTLVANSKTGRWVNQAMKAYAGVTG